MKKLIAMALTLVLLLGIFVGCGTKKEEPLVLFTWAGMFPQEVLDAFEEETGIEVIYSNFDTDETMLQKLQASDGGEYDVIIADDYIIKAAIEEELVQKLDKSKLENYGSINPIYQQQFYDPNDDYTVPYGSGVQTIVYNPEKVDIEINGYKDLWDSSLENRLGIIGNPRVINGMALKVNGVSYNTEDLGEIEKAGELLLDLAPNIRLIKDDSIQDDLLAGEIDAGVMYTSQVTMAMLANPDLKIVYPEEGIGFGIMANFIPVNAPNPDAAHKFIDYILRPEVSAECFSALGYYSTNKDADALLDDQIREYITLPEGFDTDMEMIDLVNTEASEKHMQVWTAFKAATGK